MDTSETIILGVVSGVLTSAFIYLCVTVINKIVIPAYRSAIYSGIDLSGIWEQTQDYGAVIDNVQITLKQNEKNISGNCVLTKQWKDTNKIETKVLNVKGHFQDGHLLLTMNNVDRKIQSLSTYLVRVAKGGGCLLGQMCYVDSGDGSINSHSVELSRKNV